MNHYPHHIGDFNNATRHLTRIERSIYRDLLDLYYDTEQPLPNDLPKLMRRILCDDQDACIAVIEEFFTLDDDDTWHNKRCDAEIAAYRRMGEGGKRGAAKRWASPPHSHPIATPPEGQWQPEPEPEPEPKKREPRATRLANPFVLEKDWAIWAKNERPDLDPLKTAEKFADHWHAKPGKDGLKLDWFATWRNWVKAERSAPSRPADVARTTVPLDPRNLYVVPPLMTADERAASDKARRLAMSAFKTSKQHENTQG